MSPREEKASAAPKAASAKPSAASARQSPAKGKGKGGDDTDFTTCMFCGASDGSWTEDALDLHYWKDCSLLAPCSACSQVVEVAGLPEHLLEECEHKAQFRSDPVTGESLPLLPPSLSPSLFLSPSLRLILANPVLILTPRP
jgi:hypothetical protein